MRFTLDVEATPGFLQIAASGALSLGDLCGAFDLAARVAEMDGHRRVLLRLVDVQVDLSFTEHLQLGAHAANSLRKLERAASVVSPANRRGTSEKAAQKHGLQFRTFTDLTEACTWITEDLKAALSQVAGGQTPS